MATYALNKKATFDYEIGQTYEAGLVLSGQEVKSAKNGGMKLSGAYVTLRQREGEMPEVYLLNARISPYRFAGTLADYDPLRSRKLLLKKAEIRQLIGKIQEKGLTLVPLSVYNKGNLIKLAFGVGRGKKQIDKRETIKRREVDRKLRRLQKQY